MTAALVLTGGGMPDIALKILEHQDPKTIVSFMRVNRGAHATLVSSAAIQSYLRQGLYGLHPRHGFTRPCNRPTGTDLPAHEKLRALIKAERVREFPRLGACRFFAPINHPVLTVQDGSLFMVAPHAWVVTGLQSTGPGVITACAYTPWANERIAFCAADNVVVESSVVETGVGGEKTRDITLVFYDTRSGVAAPGAGGLSPKRLHPDAKYPTIKLLADAAVPYSSSCVYEVRLHAGGLVTLLFAEPRSGSKDHKVTSAKCMTNLLVWDWKQGINLGVASFDSATTRITDVKFGSDSQLICSTIRADGTDWIPSFDLFEYQPQTSTPQAPIGPVAPRTTGFFSIHHCVKLVHIGSLQLPALFGGGLSSDGLWDSAESCSPMISEFSFDISQQAKGPSRRDQLITFRIGGVNSFRIGNFRGRKEKQHIEGVVLVSDMFRMFDEARQVQRIDQSIATDSSSAFEPVAISWADARYAVAMYTAKHDSPSVASGTRIHTLYRGGPDKKHILCQIKDYSPSMYLAPAGHLERDIGSLASAQRTLKPSPFRQVPATALSRQVLFPKCLPHGLSYRVLRLELSPAIMQVADKVSHAKMYMDEKGFTVITKNGDKVIGINLL